MVVGKPVAVPRQSEIPSSLKPDIVSRCSYIINPDYTLDTSSDLCPTNTLSIDDKNNANKPSSPRSPDLVNSDILHKRMRLNDVNHSRLGSDQNPCSCAGKIIMMFEKKERKKKTEERSSRIE